MCLGEYSTSLCNTVPNLWPLPGKDFLRKDKRERESERVGVRESAREREGGKSWCKKFWQEREMKKKKITHFENLGVTPKAPAFHLIHRRFQLWPLGPVCSSSLCWAANCHWKRTRVYIPAVDNLLITVKVMSFIDLQDIDQKKNQLKWGIGLGRCRHSLHDWVICSKCWHFIHTKQPITHQGFLVWI